jgi:RNA polymerase sigma-70 factor (ECF subfamily)
MTSETTSSSAKAPPNLSAPAETETAPPPDPAHKLLAEAVQGDETAFAQLVRLHSRRLYAIAYAILQNQTEAEEVVQDTFVKAHRELSSFRNPEKFPGWLNLVARNGARDILRRRRPQAEESALAQMEDTSVSRPGTRLDEAHVQQDLKRALASLPEEHRTALTLRYLEGQDYQGIERTMGLTNGALRGILGRALSTLRQRLQPLRIERSIS